MLNQDDIERTKELIHGATGYTPRVMHLGRRVVVELGFAKDEDLPPGDWFEVRTDKKTITPLEI